MLLCYKVSRLSTLMRSVYSKQSCGLYERCAVYVQWWMSDITTDTDALTEIDTAHNDGLTSLYDG